MCDGLADNSEDEKKIRQAQSRALLKKKKAKGSSGSRQKSYHQRRTAVESPPNPDSFRGPSSSQYRPGNSYPYNSYNASGGDFRPKPYDYTNCHKCSKPGHWKKDCPSNQNNLFNFNFVGCLFL
jgi:hypothetical protein